MKRVLRFTCAIVSHQFDTSRVSSSRFLLLFIRAVYVSKCRGFGGRFHSSRSGIDFDSCISMQNYWFHAYGTMMDRDETRPQASKNDCKILDVNRILRLSSQIFCSRSLVPESRTRYFCALKENIRDTLDCLKSSFRYLHIRFWRVEKHGFSLIFY